MRSCIQCGRLVRRGSYCAAHNPQRHYHDPAYRRLQKDNKNHVGELCPDCGEPMVLVSLDHLVELTQGGTNAVSNLQRVCMPCNHKRKKRGRLNG